VAAFQAARKGAAAALLATALSLPAAAGTLAPAGNNAAPLDPIIAAFRLVSAVRMAAASWTGDSAALSAVETQRASMSANGSSPKPAVSRAGDASVTTGSISPGGSVAPGGASKPQAELLASVPIPFGRLPALARMQPIYSDMASGLFKDCRTATCQNARATIEAVIEKGKDRKFLDLIGAVNRSVNRLVTYRRDLDSHGVIDVWSTASHTLSTGLGDCEDYAIAKMAVLQKAGVPPKSMSLVILRDEKRDVYHAVLAVSTSRGAYILDNLSEIVRRDVELPNYMPLYSVSAGRGYIYGRRAGAGALSASLGSLDGIAPGEGFAAEATAMPPASAELRGPL